MIRILLFVGCASMVLPQGDKVFRFDYEFSIQAGGWLKFHVIPGTWPEARMRCTAEGAVLATPLNSQMKRAIISIVAKHKGSAPTTIFTGIHASFSKGDYSSIEGVFLSRLPVTWAPGEPDNYDNAESCIAMNTDNQGSMSDVRCTDVLPYTCYKQDTHLTMTVCGTTDPGYTLDPRTGSCYKFHGRGAPWSEAYMTCVAEGGHLVVINNDVEARVVKAIFAKHPENTIVSKHKASCLVGFHDWGQHGNSFMTIHGETIEANFNKWSGGQPDNLTNARYGDLGQYCGGVFRNGLIDDVYCNAPVAFLCEKDPNSLLTF